VPTLSPAQIAAAADGAGFPRGELVTAVAVALGESSGNTGANLVTSREDSRGLWQINTYAHPWSRTLNLWDPDVNAAAALRVWRERNGGSWAPWTVYTRNIYRQHLDRARAGVQEHLDGSPTVGDGDPERDAGGLRVRMVGPGVPGTYVGEDGEPVDTSSWGAGDALDVLTNPAGAAADAIADHLLPEPATWRRIGQGVLGAGLVLFGVVTLVGSRAADVLPVGRVADLASAALD